MTYGSALGRAAARETAPHAPSPSDRGRSGPLRRVPPEPSASQRQKPIGAAPDSRSCGHGATPRVGREGWRRRRRRAPVVGPTELETLVVDVLGELEPATVVVAVPDTPVDALVRSGRHADLLVVGARGAGGFAGLRLGSVSRRVAARASCPVVIVPAAPADDDAGADGTTGPQIAVGVDGSDTAQAALRWALEAAPMWDASVLAVHGWGPPPAPSPSSPTWRPPPRPSAAGQR